MAIAPTQTVVEPLLMLDKNVVRSINSQREIVYSFAIEHLVGSDATAYDVVLSDDVRALNMSVLSGSIVFSSGLVGTAMVDSGNFLVTYDSFPV